MKEEFVEVTSIKPHGAFSDDLVFEDEDDQSLCLEEVSVIEDVVVDDSQNDYTFDATRFYLNELGRSKLLTADQEKMYGKRVLRGDEEARKNFSTLFKSRLAFTGSDRRRQSRLD